ncbi:MAG: hypothetical protein P4L57_08940 [Rhizomicrobium sp.]|nr:hypothetical protein [Rhizomicrobium sp.]
MPYFEFKYGDPVPEIWAAMHFPEAGEETAQKRAAYTAYIRAHYFPDYFGLSQPEPVYEVLKASLQNRPEKSELTNRRWQGATAGEVLKMVFAVAHDAPSRASWTRAVSLMATHLKESESTIWTAKRRFAPVLHLWAAWSLRGSQFYRDEAKDYSYADDLSMFLCEAMALLQWAHQSVLKADSGQTRQKAKPLIARSDPVWTPPPSWAPPTPRPNWPRDGRLQQATLPKEWLKKFRPPAQ